MKAAKDETSIESDRTTLIRKVTQYIRNYYLHTNFIVKVGIKRNYYYSI